MHFFGALSIHVRSLGMISWLAGEKQKNILTVDQLVLKALEPPEFHNVEDMLESACGPSHVPIFWGVAEK